MNKAMYFYYPRVSNAAEKFGSSGSVLFSNKANSKLINGRYLLS